MIKYHDLVNLKNKEFISVYRSLGISFQHGWGNTTQVDNMTADERTWDITFFTAHMTQRRQTECRERLLVPKDSLQWHTYSTMLHIEKPPQMV